MSVESFDLWRIACVRRMVRNNLDLIPPLDTQPSYTRNLRNFRRGVFPNIDRARRRRQREHISPISEELGPLTLADLR